MAFELDLERNIFDLYRELKDGRYKHGAYKGFWIHDPKLRRIHKATVRDRVLHHAMFSVLDPVFEPTFISDSYSCRIGKGTHKGMERVESMIRAVSKNHTHPCYALKCDIKKFFDSIDHITLINILNEKIKDEKVRALLREVIGSFESGRADLFEPKGVPIGNLTSQIFANIYMDKFDQFVKHKLKVKNYARYTDDFVIISDDNKYLEGLLTPIREFLKTGLHLELHPKKVALRKHNQGIDFLGYVILPHHIKLRTKTKRKIPKKLRQSVVLYRNGGISEISLRSSLASYLGVLSHADTYEMSNNIRNMFWFWMKE
ncbi:MAG: reverse transcriptase/maturase family protein [Candidatus Taylorbacteria bacterium]